MMDSVQGEAHLKTTKCVGKINGKKIIIGTHGLCHGSDASDRTWAAFSTILAHSFRDTHIPTPFTRLLPVRRAMFLKRGPFRTEPTNAEVLIFKISV